MRKIIGACGFILCVWGSQMAQHSPREVVEKTAEWINVTGFLTVPLWLNETNTDQIFHNFFIFLAVLVAIWSLFPIIEKLFEFGINQFRATDGVLTVTGGYYKLPSKVPDCGYINALHFQFPHQVGLTAVGIGTRNGSPGERWTWSDSGECYKFVVKNYSCNPVFNIDLQMEAAYLDVIKIGSVTRSGEALKTHRYKVPIPALKGNGEEEFIFYVYNTSRNFVNFYPVETCIIGRMGERSNTKVKVNVSNGSAIKLAFTLGPSKGY